MRKFGGENRADGRPGWPRGELSMVTSLEAVGPRKEGNAGERMSLASVGKMLGPLKRQDVRK